MKTDVIEKVEFMFHAPDWYPNKGSLFVKSKTNFSCWRFSQESSLTIEDDNSVVLTDHNNNSLSTTIAKFDSAQSAQKAIDAIYHLFKAELSGLRPDDELDKQTKQRYHLTSKWIYIIGVVLFVCVVMSGLYLIPKRMARKAISVKYHVATHHQSQQKNPAAKIPIEAKKHGDVTDNSLTATPSKKTQTMTPAPPERIDLSSLPPDQQSWGFGNRKGKKIYVFSDPLCPACQELEKTLFPFKDKYFIQVYPVSAIGGVKSVYGIQNFSCSENPAKAWQDWMEHKVFDDKIKVTDKCGLPAKQVALANTAAWAKIGFTATPVIIRWDGYAITGSLPSTDLKKWLAVQDPSKDFIPESN